MKKEHREILKTSHSDNRVVDVSEEAEVIDGAYEATKDKGTVPTGWRDVVFAYCNNRHVKVHHEGELKGIKHIETPQDMSVVVTPVQVLLKYVQYVEFDDGSRCAVTTGVVSYDDT